MLYTNLETLSNKTSGTTLTSSSHTLEPGEALVVTPGSVTGAGAPASVKHNGRTMRRRMFRENTADALSLSMWLKGEYNAEQSGTVVITWSSAIAERVATIGKLDLSINKEIDTTSVDTANTTNPGTGHTGALITAGSFVVGVRYEIDTPGTTDFTLIGAANSNAGTLFTATGVGTGTGTARQTLTVADGFGIAAFLARGPAGDAAGTLQFDLGGTDTTSWTAATGTQRVGTAGGGPLTNVTMNLGHLQFVDEESVRARINAYGTARKWASGLLVVKERPATVLSQGITPSDIIAVENIVEAAGGDTDNIYFGYNEGTGLWEAYETTTPGTLRAIADPYPDWSAS